MPKWLIRDNTDFKGGLILKTEIQTEHSGRWDPEKKDSQKSRRVMFTGYLSLKAWSHHHVSEQCKAARQGGEQGQGRQSDGVMRGFRIQHVWETTTGCTILNDLNFQSLRSLIYKIGCEYLPWMFVIEINLSNVDEVPCIWVMLEM